jgi:hypothetical protein
VQPLELPQEGFDMAVFGLDDIDERAYRAETLDHFAIGRACAVFVIECLR